MKFYIELTDHFSSFRLQKDKSWRKLETKDLQDSDLLISDINEVINLQEVDKQIILDNKNWSINPTSSNLGESRRLFYNIFVTRQSKPLTPTKDQLVSVIAQGDDRINNSLILNIYGNFELKDFKTIKLSIEDPTIVFRNETFHGGNDYVGLRASKDTKFINSLFANSLTHWLNHLRYGETNMYSDIEAHKSIDELISEIENLDLK